MDRDADRLTVFDLQNGHQDGHLDQVHEIALSASGEVLFTAGGMGLAALDANDLSQLWRVDDLRYSRVVANGDRVAAAGIADGDLLTVLDAASGRTLASRDLPGFVQGLAVGPEGSWAVRLGTSPASVQRYDAALNPLVSAETAYGEGLFYDEARGRYLLAATADDRPDRRQLVALDAHTLATVAEGDWSWDGPPDAFAGYAGGLVGIRSYEGAALDYVDPKALAPVGRTALGVLLTDLAMDQTGQVLFVADNLDRIHVLHLPDGEEQALWEGRAPIALDVPHHRLYVDRPGGVAVLDTSSGDVVAQYPQHGIAAPDPARDYVYIVEAGVTIYNRDGQRLGRLDSTFPVENGLGPNPYAFSVRVNPFNGYVVVGMNNGVPGSNNAGFLRFYPPATDSAQEVPGAFGSVVDATFSSDDGRVFASYSTARNLEALQLLDGSGRELARLGGRRGALAFDPQSNLLYVAQDGVLGRVRADSLSLQDLFRAPGQVRQVILNQATAQLYYRDETSSQIRIAEIDRLPGLDMRPQPATAPAGAVVSLVATGGDAPAPSASTRLYAISGDRLYRAADGESWERLPVGSVPIYGQITVAGAGLLFYAGHGTEGGDGVWRSRDGGDTWELLSDGLTDLRARQEVLAVRRRPCLFRGEGRWRVGLARRGGPLAVDPESR